MSDKIKQCNKCNLCNNQRPLVEKLRKCDIMWIGLSAKIVNDVEHAYPLCDDTNTGKIIAEIEANLREVSFYKTNLVKCVPLKENNKLRYPTVLEIKRCIEHIREEIKTVEPQMVFLLGTKVIEAMEKQLGKKLNKWEEFSYSPTSIDGIVYVAVHHPSYMHIYRRKYIELYIQNIVELINETVQRAEKKIN